MKHTVLWRPEAERKLAELWVDAADRNEFTNVLRDIEHSLKTNPENSGESRPNNRRLLLVPPIGILFRVEPEDRMVLVIQIWRYHTAQD